MIEEHRETEEATSAEDLGRSYGTILDQQNWEADNLDAPVPPAPAVPAEPARQVPPEPVRIIEALLFVGGPPLSPVRAGEIIRSLTPAQFLQAIDTLNRAYREQGRPYAIVPQGQGHVLTLR